MAHIVVTEFMDERAVATLRSAHEVLYAPALVDDAPRLAIEAARADALIVRNRTQVRGALLDALQRCRVVGRLGVGLDNIDVPGCEARGMRVIPATGANALSVADTWWPRRCCCCVAPTAPRPRWRRAAGRATLCLAAA